MDFWDRLEKEIDSKIERKRLMAVLSIAPNSLSTWKKRRTYPAADVIVRIAGELGVTVEYLVTGQDSANWRPPLRLANIIDDLLVLDAPGLNAVAVLAHGLAEAARVRQESARIG